MSRNLGNNPVGKAAPAGDKSQQPAPNEKTLLVCEPKGKWDEKVVA